MISMYSQSGTHSSLQIWTPKTATFAVTTIRMNSWKSSVKKWLMQIINILDCEIDINFYMLSATSVGGVMVSIDAFQALDPGSIPGHRKFFALTKGSWQLTTSSSGHEVVKEIFFSKITFE